MRVKTLIHALAFCGLCSPTLATPAHTNYADTRALPPDWYPESLAADPAGNLYVGSWRQGAVVRVSPDGKTSKIIVPPGSNDMTNGQGVLVDAERHTLWVCSGNFGYVTVPRHPTALKSFDLDSGKPLHSYPFPDGGHCNDLAMDTSHNLYVTDSLHPRILRLKAGHEALEVWKTDPAFALGKEGFDLNGIAMDAHHGLYVSLVAATDHLLHIDIGSDGQAGAVTTVTFPRILKNADGIRYAGQDAQHHDQLVIFESNAFGHDGPDGGQISAATIHADGQAGELQTLVTGLNDPSSGLIDHGRLYFIESKYSLLFSHGTADDTHNVPTGVPFDVQSIPWPADLKDKP